MIFVLLFILAVCILLYIRSRNRFISKKGWNHYYDGQAFSAEDFYKKVEHGLNERKMPGIEMNRETFAQTHVASTRREYLRITRNEFQYFICMAAFGTGTFVSSWQCEKRIGIIGMIGTIPFVGKMFGLDRSDKSFYQLDTDSMYRAAVHATVIEVLECITEEKGIRGLSELEKQLPALGK